MALFDCDFFSEKLAYETRVKVYIPDLEKKPDKLLYLLHGRGDDCSAWIRNSLIEQFAKEHQIMVVMPTAEDGFYTDSVHGKKYFTYITEELPDKLKGWFSIIKDIRRCYIAGLSMGGYGALKIGLTYPERFQAVGIFSAAVKPTQCGDIYATMEENKIFADNLQRVFGEHLMPDDDPWHLLQQDIRSGKKLPLIVQYEGKQDFLIDMNRSFYKTACSLGVDIIYEEWDGGHDWIFWNQAIAKFLDTIQ